MQYRYLRDPLFLAACLLYLANRFVLKPLSSSVFVHSYCNDFLCLPLFVPIVVLIARWCKVRDHDRPPQVHEILLPLLVWSIMFEMILPQHSYWSRWVVGDPLDIAWYSAGALVASVYWQSQPRLDRQ